MRNGIRCDYEVERVLTGANSSQGHSLSSYRLPRFDPLPLPVDPPRPLPALLPLLPGFVGFLFARDAREGLGDPSASSSSAKSVPASVPAAALSLGVAAILSSPLSWVSALLSLSPPMSPAIFLSLLLPFFVDRADGPIGIGEGAGEVDGRDTLPRIRRADMRVSNASSCGSEYSCRKKGCIVRLSDGEGDRTGIEDGEGISCISGGS